MTWQPTSNDVAYRHARQNMTELLTGVAGIAVRRVPACPEWTVGDLVRHLVQVCGFVLGRFGRDTADFPADAGDLPSLLVQWRRAGQQVEELLSGGDDRATEKLIADVFTHELDLRQALEVPPPAEHPAYPAAFSFAVRGITSVARMLDLPPLELVTDGRSWRVGDGEPVGAVEAGWYDLYRSLAGRRTHGQIRALCWSVDPAPWLPVFTWGPFTPPPHPVEHVVTG